MSAKEISNEKLMESLSIIKEFCDNRNHDAFRFTDGEGNTYIL